MAVLGSVDSHSFPCILAGEMGQIVSRGKGGGTLRPLEPTGEFGEPKVRGSIALALCLSHVAS